MEVDIEKEVDIEVEEEELNNFYFSPAFAG